MTTTTTSRSPRRKDGPAILRSGRLNKTRSGEVYDRSVPLSPVDAKRMADALAALPGFASVAAMPTKRKAMDGRSWFVRWHRDSVTLVSARSEALRDIRVERAAHQAHEMEWFLADDPETDPESTRRYCLHYYPESDGYGLYLVSLDRCECPDYQYRLDGSGLACKHINALRMHLRIPLPKPVGIYSHLPVEERKRLIERDKNWDFG